MKYTLLLMLLLPFLSCRKNAPEEIPLPTEICVKVQHHFQPIPNARIYIKYNADTFPGYDKPTSYYDRSLTADANAKACTAPVPEGVHWLVAFGYDSLYFPNDVSGSMRVAVSLDGKAKIDTILYVSE